MVNITAAEVNNLRKITGAGMMDCKKALVESEGDVDKAIEILRKKGQKVAAKRGDNEASEGLAVALSNGTQGVVVRLNCETDFVAKNDNYFQLVNGIAEVALNTGSKTIDEVKAQSFNGTTVADEITNQIGKIGEKLDLTTVEFIEAATVVAYNHPGNQVATLVGLNQAGENVEVAGKDIAMQVAAMNPVALNKESIPQSVIDKELEIGKELAIQEGKPAEMADKIAQGRLGKFFKEATLLDQEFIKDNKLSVQKYLDSVSKGLTVTAFSRVSLS
jgi:elongation factor Ts